MAREAAPTAVPVPRVNASLPGAAIYAQRCAGCHGASGEGMALRRISSAPDRYQHTASLVGLPSPWLRDRNQFAALVVKGLPGRTMPGNATLTRQQLDDLYAFVRHLRKDAVIFLCRVVRLLTTRAFFLPRNRI